MVCPRCAGCLYEPVLAERDAREVVCLNCGWRIVHIEKYVERGTTTPSSSGGRSH